MKVAALLALAGAILLAHPAEARKAKRLNLSPVPVSGAMVDDRYPHLRLPEAYGTARAQQRQARPRARQPRKVHVVRRKAPVSVPLPTPRPTQAKSEERTSEPPANLAQGLVREVGRAFGGRPAGCPTRAWCGCWLGHHLGMPKRDLWLARNWAHVGRPAHGPAPGVIVVWSHHVGKITAVSGNRIRVLSGNDGRRVRDRWRTVRGVIAYRVAG